MNENKKNRQDLARAADTLSQSWANRRKTAEAERFHAIKQELDLIDHDKLATKSDRTEIICFVPRGGHDGTSLDDLWVRADRAEPLGIAIPNQAFNLALSVFKMLYP